MKHQEKKGKKQNKLTKLVLKNVSCPFKVEIFTVAPKLKSERPVWCFTRSAAHQRGIISWPFHLEMELKVVSISPSTSGFWYAAASASMNHVWESWRAARRLACSHESDVLNASFSPRRRYKPHREQLTPLKLSFNIHVMRMCC